MDSGAGSTCPGLLAQGRLCRTSPLQVARGVCSPPRPTRGARGQASTQLPCLGGPGGPRVLLISSNCSGCLGERDTQQSGQVRGSGEAVAGTGPSWPLPRPVGGKQRHRGADLTVTMHWYRACVWHPWVLGSGGIPKDFVEEGEGELVRGGGGGGLAGRRSSLQGLPPGGALHPSTRDTEALPPPNTPRLVPSLWEREPHPSQSGCLAGSGTQHWETPDCTQGAAPGGPEEGAEAAELGSRWGS